MFALVDCDQFFVSCERVFDPKLKGIPVGVLSNNDGCVVARSPEIKAIGVKMGDPYFKIKALLKKHKAVVFSSNYELYGNMSARVMNILQTFSNDVEIYSVDEAFIRLSKYFKYSDTSKEISTTIEKWTGIPVKVGVAETKTLCKVAAELVKMRQIKNKYYILTDPVQIEEDLRSFDVSEIWGIGRKTTEKLYSIGIRTAGELCKYPEDVIKKRFGINLLRTTLELKGTQCFSIETVPQPKQSMRFSRSFGKPAIEYNEMHESVVYFATSIAANLRKANMLASAVSAFITTNYFNKDDLQYSNSFTVSLKEQSNSTNDIVSAAITCLDTIFREGYRYKKSGVLLIGLVDQKMSQGNLFTSQNIKNDQISATMDEINRKFGRGAIKLAGEGIATQEWKMQRGKLSHNYTNDWDDLLKVK